MILDFLDRIFSLLRTQGQTWGRITLTGRYGLAFPKQHAVFIAVMEGKCWINQDDGPLIGLNPGDFLFLPSPSRFHLRSDVDVSFTSPLTDTQFARWEKTRILEHRENIGGHVSLVAGCFTFVSAEAPLLFRDLPSILHAPACRADELSHQVVMMMRDEIVSEEAGATSTVDRLAEILMIRTLRNAIRNRMLPGIKGWIGAISDSRIHEALRLMHQDLAVVYTVEQIARSVGMSRSAFAERFRALVGKTPQDHLIEWRIAHAADLLRQDQKAKIGCIAAQVGYMSERAFREAFARSYGCSPDKFRKNSLAMT